MKILSFQRLSTFWIGMLLIVALAAGLRLLSYDFSLPYVDHPDEPTYYVGGQEWRVLVPHNPYYDGVPPAYLALHTGLQPILESLGISGLAPTIRVMRLLTAAANVLTLVVIAQTARLAGGDLAGLAAGLAWGISPPVLENGVYALPDPFVYLFVALSVWLAAVALVNPKRRNWCVWSVAAGLIAVLFKYPALPVVAAGGVTALVIAARDWRGLDASAAYKPSRYRGLILLAIQMILVAGVGLWLVKGYGLDLNNLQREGAVIKNQGLSNFFNLSRTLNNLYFTIFPIHATAFAIIAVGGMIAFLIAPRQQQPRVRAGIIGLAAVSGVTIAWLANTFSQVDPINIRYVLPATTAACVILGAALAQIANVLPGCWSLGKSVVALPLVLLVFIPQFRQDVAIVRERRLPDWRVDLRQWFDTNLDPGTVIVTQDNHKTFNPFFGGIPYRHWTDWWMSEDITEHSLDEWVNQRQMRYAVLPKTEWAAMEKTDAGRAYLGQMLHLRDFFQPPDTRGPEMVVYRLRRMENETSFHFGDQILLKGYDQSATQGKPGEAINFRFYWQAVATPSDNYSLFIHMVPSDEYKVLAQADGAPAVPERPTLSWNVPSETLISPVFSVSLPADLKPGDYRVMIGLYNYKSGQRLPIADGNGKSSGDALQLTTVQVGNP